MVPSLTVLCRWLSFACLALSSVLWAPAHAAAGTSRQESFYAGLYPALSARYAATLQTSVDAGKRPWLLRPALVAQAFARFIGWPGKPASARVIRRRGTHALVRIDRQDTPQIKLSVDLARLGRQRGGIWSVIGCHTDNMRLTTPAAGARVSSPVLIRGTASVFEGAFLLRILDEQWQPIGSRRMQIRGQQRTPFVTRLPFRRHGTYGIIKAYAGSARDGKLEQVAMVKVGLR